MNAPRSPATKAGRRASPLLGRGRQSPSRGTTRRTWSIAALGLAAACGEPEPAPRADAPVPAKTDAPAVVQPERAVDPPTPSEAEDPPLDPLHVTVVEPHLLEWLDVAGGYSFVDVLARLHREQAWPAVEASTSIAAAASASWGAVVAVMRGDLERLIADMAIDWEVDIDRTYDRSAAKTREGADAKHRGNGNVARVFDVGWLTSHDAKLPLVAVVYRPDRAEFHGGGCGELRLLYRLAYHRRSVDGVLRTSRLPLVVNVVFALADDGSACKKVARSFAGPVPVGDAGAAAWAAALRDGPLAGARLMQLELNAQVVRFPSDLERVEGRGFAGQAAYWLRIFAPKGDALAPIPLENTPDVLAIRRDPDKRARLLESLAAQREGIDRGVFLLPSDLLADVAISWSTHGSVRAANRPFSSLLSREEVDGLLAGWPEPRAFVGGRAALLERLDTATCMGCHQSGSTAGFHVLGVDRPIGDDAGAWTEASDGNRLALAMSPHMLAEQPRRLAWAEALARGMAPDRTRLHPSAPPAAWSGGARSPGRASIGMPCPIGDALAEAARWPCDVGLHCAALARAADRAPVLGVCMPELDDIRAGAPCRAVEVTAGPDAVDGALAFNARAFEDRAPERERPFAMADGAMTTLDYNCRPPAIGVPLGRVTRRCSAFEWRLTTPTDQEVCAIVGGKGFEQMATGAFDAAAFAASAGRGLLDVCSAARPCREDYICQRLPDFLATPRHQASPERLAALQDAGVGFCTPTYFVYQLRLDGHPRP